MQTGIQFLPDTTWQIEMEEAFEFVETPDQLKAIEQVKKIWNLLNLWIG